MNKQALEARAAALQIELDKLKAELAKPVLPEGFTPFQATELDAPPCHPQDLVIIYTQDGQDRSEAREAKWFNWSKKVGSYLGWEIVGYKVVRKFKQPRLMKYSEMPVGQMFMWGSPMQDVPALESVYMKISMISIIGKTDNAVVLSHGKDSISVTGELTLFTDDEIKFYAVDYCFKKGEPLMVQPS